MAIAVRRRKDVGAASRPQKLYESLGLVHGSGGEPPVLSRYTSNIWFTFGKVTQACEHKWLPEARDTKRTIEMLEAWTQGASEDEKWPQERPGKTDFVSHG